ncbi:Ribosomal large subunit pseudouridine synthase D [hydrothermal vent metagenome]|uniref:Ribosomal large subunit pseudouridine synthase D n=1 Tax=hydrothermal vent metagenome TaxID=652676 RepID=A0A3B1C781_9ZZZZ
MKVPGDSEGDRLDRFLALAGLGLTRTRAGKLIELGAVLVDGHTAKASTNVKEGQTITVNIPEPQPLDVEAQDIPLEIVYEDDDIVVVNKPAAMVTHPGAGHSHGTLVNALLHHCKFLSGIGGVLRPGIVHRLDKDTSGLIVVAKNDAAHLSMSEQLKSRTLSRKYLAVVKGFPKKREGEVNAPVGRHPKNRKKMAVVENGGKEAVTRYKTLQEMGKATLLEISLVTGRTHQIRVHMLSINHPVIGDRTYSRGAPDYKIKRQALHAWKISFQRPSDGEVIMLKAPMPDDMKSLVELLGGDPSSYL